MIARRSTLFALALALLALPTTLTAQVSVEAQIAEAVVDLEPQNPMSSFPAEVGQVACWTRVTGAEGSTIQHVWIHGEMQFPVTLNVGASPWRTYSTKTIPPEWSGDWRVEIRDADGNLLDTVSFTVGAQ